MRYVYRCFLALVHYLPRPLGRAVGVGLGLLWFDVFRIRRALILENLEIAFPNLSSRDRVRLGRRSCIHLGHNFVEFCDIPHLTIKDADRFEIVGLENLICAEKKDRGICILTLHLGNGDLAGAGFALHKRCLTVISKEFKVKWLNEEWFRARESLGTKFIAARNSTFEIMKSLKRRERVAFVLDQFMGPPIGVKTTFFGRETGTSMGLAVIAARVGTPVVPVYTHRLPNGRHRVVIDPEIPWESREDYNQSLAHMTQRYADWVESAIRKHPEQWMWVHRRWKAFKIAKDSKFAKLKKWHRDEQQK